MRFSQTRNSKNQVLDEISNQKACGHGEQKQFGVNDFSGLDFLTQFSNLTAVLIDEALLIYLLIPDNFQLFLVVFLIFLRNNL